MNCLASLGSILLGVMDPSLEPPRRTPVEPYFWLPDRGSTFAGEVDWVFNFILAISVFFFALIVGLMVMFVIRYRRRPGREQAGPAATHSTPLELFWTFIPIVLVVFMFFFGFEAFMDMRTAPRETYEVQVEARQWGWTFKYANDYPSDELHIPAGKPVKLVMRSADVIHSLFIPQFRIKQDLVPGRFTYMWFRADAPGVYDLWCAEYCGKGHADMLTKVVVHEPADFEKWLSEAANYLQQLPPEQAGAKVFAMRGCGQCHSVEGKAGTGPALNGIWGETHRFNDGSTALVDENYIRESILEPSKKIREGFANQMSTFKGVVSDRDIDYLIAYLKTLKKQE